MCVDIKSMCSCFFLSTAVKFKPCRIYVYTYVCMQELMQNRNLLVVDLIHRPVYFPLGTEPLGPTDISVAITADHKGQGKR